MSGERHLDTWERRDEAEQKVEELEQEAAELRVQLRDESYLADELEASLKLLRETLGECDSLISLIRHRRNLDWGTRSLPESWEVDQLIGRIRAQANAQAKLGNQEEEK